MTTETVCGLEQVPWRQNSRQKWYATVLRQYETRKTEENGYGEGKEEKQKRSCTYHAAYNFTRKLRWLFIHTECLHAVWTEYIWKQYHTLEERGIITDSFLPLLLAKLCPWDVNAFRYLSVSLGPVSSYWRSIAYAPWHFIWVLRSQVESEPLLP